MQISYYIIFFFFYLSDRWFDWIGVQIDVACCEVFRQIEIWHPFEVYNSVYKLIKYLMPLAPVRFVAENECVKIALSKRKIENHK